MASTTRSTAVVIVLVATTTLMTGCGEVESEGHVDCPVNVEPWVHFSNKAAAQGKPDPVDAKPYVSCTGTVDKAEMRSQLQIFLNNKWINVGSPGFKDKSRMAANYKLKAMATAPCYDAPYRVLGSAKITVNGVTTGGSWYVGKKTFDDPCNLG